MKIGPLLLGGLAMLAAPRTEAADKVPVNVGISVVALANPFFVPLVEGAKAAVVAANPKARAAVVGADYDPNGMAKQATDLAIDVMQGKGSAPPVVLLDTTLVTKDNVATAKGWDGSR